MIRDGRLNNGVGEFGAPLAAYCEAGGVSVWDIDGEGQGSFAFVASAEAISAGLAAAVASGENVLIAEGLGNSLYALASGELSMVGSYLDEPFKQYQFIADSAVCG